jgi:hypothetical protein
MLTAFLCGGHIHFWLTTLWFWNVYSRLSYCTYQQCLSSHLSTLGCRVDANIYSMTTQSTQWTYIATLTPIVYSPHIVHVTTFTVNIYEVHLCVCVCVLWHYSPNIRCFWNRNEINWRVDFIAIDDWTTSLICQILRCNEVQWFNTVSRQHDF